MSYNKIICASLLLIMAVFVPCISFAAKDPTKVGKLDGRITGQLIENNFIETEDQVFGLLTERVRIDLTRPQKYVNVVSLMVAEDDANIITSDFDCEITINIEFTRPDGSTGRFDDHKLKVTYRKNLGIKFDAAQYLTFNGAYKVKVTVVDIETFGATWDVTKFLILYNNIDVTRDYKFNVTAQETVTSVEDNGSTGTIDELLVSWNMNPTSGCTHYDIEWAWIDIDASNRYMVNGSYVSEKVFSDNSTRITIDKSGEEGVILSYRIPTLYDGEGYIFYRIRPIQLLEDGRVVNGAWSINNTTNDYFLFTGHENNLNWQATTSYAEEGKRKTVIQYFDGTLRGRQTVTKDNVSNTTVVAEILYDFQGRPAIQILPAPTLSNTIQFSKNFNRFQFIPVDTYEKEIYDYFPLNGNVCNATTPPLVVSGPPQSIVGAGQYYSPNNPLVNDNENKFIPDAEGYPYTETRYTQDASGRLIAQSGVGINHKIGSNKETKYFYGSPTQKELDALFGVEVGNASHYYKNMVRDANGQYSVSYVDMAGRTIATALAGTNPNAVLPINSLEEVLNNNVPVVENLLSPVNNKVVGRKIISSNTLVVPKSGEYVFNYQLSPESAAILACNPAGQTVCYDCLYDLVITITDNCGSTLFQWTATNFSLTLDETCTPAQAITILNKNEILQEGEYTVTKVLSLSSQGQTEYKENLFKTKNICKTFQEFYNQIYNVIVLQNNCSVTCQECNDAVGTFSSFKAQYLAAIGITTASASLELEIQSAYDQNKSFCNRLCGNVSPVLENYETLMLADMTPPTGQYTDINRILIDHNIYKINGNLQPYLNPKNEDSSPGTYNDELGQVDPYAYDVMPGSSSPVFSFSTPQEFENKFKTSWAKSLLPYHPEYCKYQVATSTAMQASYAFDERLKNVDNYTDATASANNFINNLLNQDPFFTGVGSAFKDDMQEQIEVDYITSQYNNITYTFSMWQIAWMSIHCQEDVTIGINEACALNAPKKPPFTVTDCAGDWNNVWRTFRTMYLTAKNSWVDRYFDNQCQGTQNFYNNLSTTQYRRVFGTAQQLSNNYNPNLPNNYLGSISTTNPSSNPAEIQMAESFAQTCSSYVQSWKTDLLRCDAIRAITPDSDREDFLTEITNALMDVCRRGSDVNHPIGSSTVRTGDTQPFVSFEAVIEHYLGSRSIPISELCHPFLISFPKPYETQPPIANYTTIIQQDPCVCDKLALVRNNKNADGFIGTLSEYINYKHGVSIAQADLDILQNGCNGNPDCLLYDPGFELPGFFACGAATETCIECDKYFELYSEFQAVLPSLSQAPFENPSDDFQHDANQAFEDFMNAKTGFSKNWSEYLRFKIACESGNPDFECPYLQGLVTLFQQTYPNLTGQACRDQFVIFFNQQTGRFYTWPDIEEIFIRACGSLPTVCSPTISCIQFNDLLVEFYLWYHAIPVSIRPECRPAFISYFNAEMGTDYTEWQEIADIHTTLACPGDLNVCEEFPCFMIDHVIMLFRQTNAWIYADCQDRFDAFFNNYFGTNYNASEIWDIVSNCYDRFNICMPPYSSETIQQYIDHYNSSADQNCISTFPIDTEEYCRDCFTQYMNQSLGTTFTYVELELLVLTITGNALTICGANYQCQELTSFVDDFLTTFPDLDPSICLERFVEEFNSHFNTDYDIREINDLYILYCGHEPGVCKFKGRPGAYDLNVIYAEFRRLYPNPSVYFDNCEDGFVDFYETMWGNKIDYDSLVNLYIEIAGSMPGVCSVDDCSAINLMLVEYQATFGSFNLPLQMRKDILVKFYKTRFTPGEDFTWDHLELAFQNCAINFTLSQDSGPLLSCSKVNGVKKAFYTINNYALPENCSELFVGFFNFYYSINFTYEQIMDWGLQNCNYDLNICGINNNNNEFTLVERRSTTGSIILPPRLCGLNASLSPPITVEEDDPCEYNAIMANNAAFEQYNNYVTTQLNNFDIAYENKCLQAASLETFTVSYIKSEYHYTLYYYDQAGHLLKTVPPEGVQPNRNATYLQGVANFRANESNPRPIPPNHNLVTQYRYNTLGHVIAQSTPDAGISKFWYDKLGRLVLSQNAKQAITGKYSFTIYDNLGRISEVGEKVITGIVDQDLTQNEASLSSALAGNRYNITHTSYDETYPPFCGNLPSNTILCQENIRNRVSYTYTQSLSTNTQWDAATFYSYDIHGNVATLLQDFQHGVMNTAGHRFKKIEYNYDLISGKVNEVSYQPGKSDAFYHRYSYDAENRLKKVETSRDHIFWQQDATYKYYKHGPLARTVLGDLRVQGIDYAYTLQGWLKGVNSSSVGNADFDIGGDGKIGTSNQLTARDAYGFMLNYYEGAYKPIHPAANTLTGNPFIQSGLHHLNNIESMVVGQELYNGNIASMFVNIPQLGNASLYAYRYDQLNRLKSMDLFTGFSNTTNNWSGTVPIASQDYKERISYDANGNIKTYTRNGAAAQGGTPMDQFTYQYEREAVTGKLKSNKLRYVFDEVVASSYTEDIESQTNLTSSAAVNADLNSNLPSDNFEYDAIGNLIKDSKEGISNIEWSVYGKILFIQKGSTLISYTYDASGNRISKTVNNKTTWYVRDASGNVMSVYEKEASNDLVQKELHIYGSSRLGIYEVNTNMELNTIPGGNTTFIRGNKFFELSNHLGNVLVTVSDKKIAVSTNGTTIDYYTADVVTASDYYPGGMVMPGRKHPAAGGLYRYGFNGKENDNEVKGEGNQQDYGMRIYDPRLVKFLSVDPISNDYPELTPYQFASNRPIDGIDQDGLEYAKANMHSDATIVRHNSDPHIAQEQIIAAPQRRNAVIAQDVQRKINTQARSVLTKYKEPDVAQKQRNASLQKNHDAKTVPENNWTRNKHLNNLSERMAEPMAEMAVGEGLGKVAIKGISALMKIGNEAKYLYHYTSPKSAESIMRTGFTITENRPFIYATNVSNLTGVQAKIELALPFYNPGTSIIRINATNLDAAIIRRVTGNLPGLSSGGGKEFIFNQNIPKSLLKQIK